LSRLADDLAACPTSLTAITGTQRGTVGPPLRSGVGPREHTGWPAQLTLPFGAQQEGGRSS